MATLSLKRPRVDPYSVARTLADCDDGAERRLKVGFSNGQYTRQTYSTREPHEPVVPKRALERFKLKPKRKGKR